MRRFLTSGFAGLVMLAGAAGVVSAQAATGPATRAAESVEQQTPDTVKGAYLGVATSAPPLALRRQLDLPDGVGLLIEAVAEQSPAADAGLKQYDLLHKLNDQILINPQQLAVLVRTCKPGDEIALSIFRSGKLIELKAKLIEKDLPPLERLRLMVDDPLDLFPGRAGSLRPSNIQLQLQPRHDMPPGPLNLLEENFILSWDDGTMRITVNAKGGKKMLQAVTREGKTLCDGPIDTPEQREALPAEVKERIPHLLAPGFVGGGPRAAEASTRPTTTPAGRVP